MEYEVLTRVDEFCRVDGAEFDFVHISCHVLGYDVKVVGHDVKMFWGNVSLKLKKLVQGVYEMVHKVYGQIWLIFTFA